MQTIEEIEQQANQLLQNVYIRKSQTITNYHRRKNDEIPELGFASVGFPDESMDCDLIFEILQPGFIFEVIVTQKQQEKGKLEVILQKFLAFSDKCHQSKQADFNLFRIKRHLLSQLSQINVMRMKGIIYESEVIEDFSIFTYYLNFNKIQVGDHLNAVLIDKQNMIMSLKNKNIMGGKQWSLKSLQNPSHFDNWLYFRLGYTKQIGLNFQYEQMTEEEQQKQQQFILSNLKYKEESGILKMDYQIRQDVYFQNKQNYVFMQQSLGLNQNTSFTERNNLKSFFKFNLDHRRRLYNILIQTIKHVLIARCPISPKAKEQLNYQMIIDIENENDKADIDEKLEVPIYPLIPQDNYIIQVRNVHKTYLLGLEGVTALRGVSFNVYEREFITILGTSGCGKTTLLNLLGSIDLPTKGDVKICGQRIRASTEDKFLASLRLSQLGFVFQQFNLISSLTAIENVELPMILKGTLNKSTIRQQATELLSQVGLAQRMNHFPNQLSGGEQQRVTIARALANRPQILLLDEPTGDLDTKNSDLIMNIIIDLNISQGITIIMVTHDTNLKNYSTRTIRMLDGKVASDERNDEQNRKKHIDDLRSAVQQYQNGDYGVRAGTGDEGQITASKTEKRKPKDYKVLNHFYVQNTGSPYNQQQNNINSFITPNATPNLQIQNKGSINE